MRKTRELLLAFLHANPDAAADLVQALMTNEYGRLVEETVFFALAKVGGPEAERALAMAAKSPDIEMDNRMRASCGLASTRNPSDLVIDALLSAPMGEYSGADDDGRFFQRTALVHVGARANQRYGRLTEEHTERVRQRLNEALSNAEELNEKTAALAAIGNSGDRELLSELTPHLEDSEALV